MPSLHQVFLECINFDCIGFSQFSLRVLINQSEETSNDTSNPVDNYMFKVINRNTRIRCEIYLKLTIKTPMAPLWCSYFTPWCPYFTPCSSVSIVKFQQIYAGWETSVTADRYPCFWIYDVSKNLLMFALHAENIKTALHKQVLVKGRENEIHEYKWLFPIKSSPSFSSYSFGWKNTNYSH